MTWFKAFDKSSDSVEIDVYGDIGDDLIGDGTSTSAKEFIEVVRSARGKAIELRINSGGGSVFDAFAMMAALSDHDGKVTAHVDGVAASAASFLLAAADEVRIASVGYVMVHESSALSFGNASELRAMADWLSKIDAQIATVYAKRTGRSEEEFRDAMRATTWFTAQSAVEWGLADAIDEVVSVAACATSDIAALMSAPEGALKIMGDRDKPGSVAGAEGDADGVQEHAEAQERAVVVNGSVYKLKTSK